MLFLSGLLFGAAVTCGVVYCYFASGYAPVATSDPELPFESVFAGKALRKRMRRELPPSLPSGTENDLLGGARLYVRNCAECHGLPAGPVSTIAPGMYPPPPQLFHNQGVITRSMTDDYWKISNGIRFTGMPPFRETLTDEDIWEITVLLAESTGRLPPSVLKELSSPATASH